MARQASCDVLNKALRATGYFRTTADHLSRKRNERITGNSDVTRLGKGCRQSPGITDERKAVRGLRSDWLATEDVLQTCRESLRACASLERLRHRSFRFAHCKSVNRIPWPSLSSRRCLSRRKVSRTSVPEWRSSAARPGPRHGSMAPLFECGLGSAVTQACAFLPTHPATESVFQESVLALGRRDAARFSRLSRKARAHGRAVRGWRWA